MKFSEGEQDGIWKIVATVLHLGNLGYDDKNLDNNTPCSVLNDNHLISISKLLGSNLDNLRDGLLKKTREIGNYHYSITLIYIK